MMEIRPITMRIIGVTTTPLLLRWRMGRPRSCMWTMWLGTTIIMSNSIALLSWRACGWSKARNDISTLDVPAGHGSFNSFSNHNQSNFFHTIYAHRT